jgi:cyanophycin synthetase
VVYLCIHLERLPFKREDFDQLTGGQCKLLNGLLMLGHGVHQHVLDGTYCIDKSEDFNNRLMNQDQHGAMYENRDADFNFPDSSADRLMDWLFPDNDTVRMPIIAVTGTNGKTTTSRMISHIMALSGHKPGLVCTDGIYLDGKLLESGDKSTRAGHLKVLTSKAVDVAVLETHHSGILTHGFAFRWCDIAVCLNVTEDHLGQINIDTVEQMAIVKQALLERARHAAVLNADDRFCLAMLEAVTAEKICLVSMLSSHEELSAHVGKRLVCYCVLELLDGEEWLLIHDCGLRLPVMASSSIPATFDGTARFNVSNAMHAIAASYLFGTDVEVIKSAMCVFKSGYETTPGRMNVFDDLPFRIIMDFSHNPDGMRNVSDFIDRQIVPGRKLIAFAGGTDRSAELLRGIGRSLAGHFDFYFCKEYVTREGRDPRKVSHFLQQGLIEAGVAEQQTVLVTNGKEVIFEIFDACKAGDLLVMLMGHVEIHHLPAYIREYASIQD